jgi:hypothetical protein
MEEAAVHRLATSITLTLCQVAEEIDTATKLVYKACQKLRDIPDVPPQRITDLENVTRQLLWCGRSRSKARSLHENKLLSKKTATWTQVVACELANHKNQETKHTNKKARRRSPGQICVSPSQGQRSKQRKGQEPNHKKDLPKTQWYNPLCRYRLKSMQQTN